VPAIGVADPDDAERICAALAEGGEVTMPLQQALGARR
jgi:hypothetical protein